MSVHDGVSSEQGYIEDPPFADGTFDGVVSNGVVNLSAEKDPPLGARTKRHPAEPREAPGDSSVLTGQSTRLTAETSRAGCRFPADILRFIIY